MATRKAPSAASATGNLLRPPSARKKARQEYIADWLRHIGIGEIESEFQTGSGPVDLYLANRRVLIEVKSKARLKNGPNAPRSGSRGGESAFQQISRHIEAERRQDRPVSGGGAQSRLSWIGIVTDGERWWAWEWPEKNANGEPVPRWQDTKLTEGNIKALEGIITRGKAGKDWVPADPSTLFEGSLAGLKELFLRVKSHPATNTQKKLWLEQLQSGGNAPTSDVDDMFVAHTLLILIARIVLNTVIRYRHDSSSGDSVTEGFVGWVVTVDRSHLEKLESIITEYDWARRPGDVLRTLYGHFVEGRHRKAFGEYYTPDWLAEMICLEIIDDDFIAKQIDAFRNGDGANVLSCVLDPTCGSGTFLYSAARRILESKPLERSAMDEDRKALFVASMVHGMDIHPVAVEMARANVARALPRAPRSNINVRQGDALLGQRSDMTVFGDGGKSAVLFSPAGLPIPIPMEFFKSAVDMDAFFKSASAGEAMPKSLEGGLPGESRQTLREAHRSLRGMAAGEPSGARYWHMRNQVAPVSLGERRVGRIVSNPPWVTMQEMRDASRKGEVRRLARSEGIWVGGDSAPRFDVAGLFVKKCLSLYLDGGRSAWVLPQGAAVSGKSWEGFRAAMSGMISEFWDMRRLPFPWTPACVAITGPGGGAVTRTYAKRRGQRVSDGDRWASVEAKTRRVSRRAFPARRSDWFDRRGGLPVRHGASLQPAPLVRIRRIAGVSGGSTSFETYASHKGPWDRLGSIKGTVPSGFVKDTIISTYVFPFIAICNKTIMPVEGGAWAPGRNRSRYWRDACALYEKHRGDGPSNPKTLEGCMDHHGKLMRQLGSPGGHRVVYNAVGDALYASRIRPGVVGGVGVCVVSARSRPEALFLAGVLNAPCLLGAYLSTRRSDRNFHMHFWGAIPIPRYDRSDAGHVRLAELAQKAEAIASRVPLTGRPLKDKGLIRGALAGVLGEIDGVVSGILPGYAAGARPP